MRLLFIVIIALSLLKGTGAKAQNLVPDPAFEVTDTCPSTVGQLACLFFPMPFTPTLRHWFNPNINTPDYFNRCALAPMLSVPGTFIGHQQPRSGDGFVGIVVYDKSSFESWSNNYREYVMCKLKEPLTAGRTYRVSCFISMACPDTFRNWMAIDELEASLSFTAPESMGLPLTNSCIKLKQAGGGFVKDSAGWTEVSGYYAATGGEQWLTLGCFYNGDVPNGERVRPLLPARLDIKTSYYFIDDAAVVACDTTTAVTDTLLPCNAAATLTATSAMPHLWSTGSTTDTIVATEQGVYWCYSAEGCMVHSDSFRVTIAKPVLDNSFALQRDTTICNTDTYMLGRAIGGVRYSWNTGDTACCIQPYKSGVYTVVADDGCISVTDSAAIIVNECEQCLFVPTAFTPNGDGRNDDFGVVNKCELQHFYLQVFDRWGEMVYEATSANGRWDGTYKGRPMELGVYFYSITYSASLAKPLSRIKGDITLIR